MDLVADFKYCIVNIALNWDGDPVSGWSSIILSLILSLRSPFEAMTSLPSLLSPSTSFASQKN